jgi:hypothetical protein
MPSAIITCKNLTDNNQDYSLIGSTPTGAEYKDASRSLALPQTLKFSMKIGNPGAKGNDKMTITMQNTKQNSTTGEYLTGTAKIELSIPRDAVWTASAAQDLIVQLQDLFSDTNSAAMADMMVP